MGDLQLGMSMGLVVRPLLTLKPTQQGCFPGTVHADHCNTALGHQSKVHIPQDSSAHRSYGEAGAIQLQEISA
eukprot:CAMPEP_0115752126 /NCGR_PEP_ID=MMETSP0272-20121206/95626_1 /TAXON_ID=71861 /ORGANISM="Scrippsiella trochoidea, Strain CCMP3099" /LENGTH=72 /DNA_ID=CAMNT_0003197357 /DNA_START=36 /DNA_END=254 /DNA_ORIENTATION=+